MLQLTPIGEVFSTIRILPCFPPKIVLQTLKPKQILKPFQKLCPYIGVSHNIVLKPVKSLNRIF